MSEERLVAGRYRLVTPLGTGGMGTVWRAQDTLLRREVAVKEVVFPRGMTEPEREHLRERTRREARAAARLDHPSAVTVYDVVEQDGQPFLVMELVDSRNLAEVVRSEGPLAPSQAARVGLELLGALESAHAQGILHRDVKPGNVLLRDDGRVVLTDFGIASTAGDPSITGTGLLLGSPAYIAPERARGQSPGPASDLWSLGATLFTAVEGQPPFGSGDPLTTLTAVVSGEHAPFVNAGPLAPVLDGLLAKDPRQRLTTGEARTRLSAVAASGDTARPGPAAAAAVAGADRTAVLSLPAPAAAVGATAEPLAGAALGGAARSAHAVPDAGGPTAADPAPGVPRPDDVPGPVRPAGDAPAVPRVVRARAAEPPVPPAGRRRRPLAVLLGMALLAAAVVAGYLLVTHNGSGGTAAPRPRASAPAGTSPSTGPSTGPSAEPSTAASASAGPSAPPSSSPSAAASPGPTTGTVSGGRYSSPAGWSIGLPPGWAPATFRGTTQLRNTATGSVLRVDTSPLGGDVLAAVRDTAAQFAGRHTGYRQLQLAPAQVAGQPGVLWEFTYTDGGTPLHTAVESFTAGGHSYALLFQAHSDTWQAAQADRAALLSSFRPAGS